MKPTKDILEEMKAVCDAATEGEWFTDDICYVFNNANCEIMVLQARGTGAGLTDEQQANNLRLADSEPRALYQELKKEWRQYGFIEE